MNWAINKRGRKRYFSVIFVPDQEKNPRSIAMSYAKGRLLIVLMIGFIIHIFLGGIGYYKIFQLEKMRSVLNDENQELKARNKKIEMIAKEFQEIRKIDEKIRKAFSGSLGLIGQGALSHEDIRKPSISNEITSGMTISTESSTEIQSDKIQNGLYFFLKEKSGGYFDPEHLPTLLPIEGFLSKYFQKGGWIGGRTHFGIDIAAKKGSVIRAAGAGIILLADWTPDFGNMIIISHGGGFFSYYAHTMRFLVDQGFEVRKGQPIALLGSSGISSAPHLHFEIWKDNEPLDPEKFIFALQRKEPEKDL